MGGGRARGGGGSDRPGLGGESVCVPPGPGQRVAALGDEGSALTGKSGHRGGGGGGSEGTRDGSASGGGSRQGGLRWQRPLRCWRTGRLGTRAAGTRGAFGVRTPASSPQLSKLRAPVHPPSAPGVNNFFTPLHPCPRPPSAPGARRAAGTRTRRPLDVAVRRRRAARRSSAAPGSGRAVRPEERGGGARALGASPPPPPPAAARSVQAAAGAAKRQGRGDVVVVAAAGGGCQRRHLGLGESGRLHPEIGAQGAEAEALSGLVAVPQPGQPAGAAPLAPAQRCHFK